LFPQQAVMLSLFDWTKTFYDIKKIVSYLFNLSEEDAIEQIETLLSLPVSSTAVIGSLIEKTTDAERPLIRSYDPRAFVIPADEIDMVDVRSKRPTRILVLPTMKCATECLYCYANTDGMKGKKPFGLEVFKQLLRDVHAYGIETVEFSGSDLFCRSDAFELIEAVFQEGLCPGIPTKCL
jgi:hypothetical protein